MPQPYPGQNWKHGWIPVTPAAAASKAKKGPPPSPNIGKAAASAGAILRRMKEQDARRGRGRSVTHVVDGKTPKTTSGKGGGKAPSKGSPPTKSDRGGAGSKRTTGGGDANTSRTADDAIRKAAGRKRTKKDDAPTSKTPAPAKQQETRKPPTVERAMDDIRDTYFELAEPTRMGTPSRVSLVDLRKRLPDDLSRQQVDDALARLNVTPDVFVVPQSNQKILTPEQRAAAVRIADQDKHWIEIEVEPGAQWQRRRQQPAPTTGAGRGGNGGGGAGRPGERPAPQPQRQPERPTPRPAPETRSRENAPTASPAPKQSSSDGKGRPVDGSPSNKPLARNVWGTGSAQDNEIAYHDDGAIGTAIKDMGPDARMDVDGEPLANVLGRLATDAVAGRKSTQEMVDAVKAVRNRLPAGSAARRELDRAIAQMDAPNTPPPKIPDGSLQPLRKLAQDLHKIPTVRNDPDLELNPLVDLMNQFAEGRAGGRRFLTQVRSLANKRHESSEGKAEIDRVINQAVQALERMQAADRTALYPTRR